MREKCDYCGAKSIGLTGIYIDRYGNQRSQHVCAMHLNNRVNPLFETKKGLLIWIQKKLKPDSPEAMLYLNILLSGNAKKKSQIRR